MCAARLGQASAPLLLSVLDHATDAVRSQARVRISPTRSPPSGAPRPRRGSGHRRCHAHTGGHRPADPRSGRPLRAHTSRRPEDSAQDAQGPALEEGPVRLKRRHRLRAAGGVPPDAVQAPKWVDFPAAALVVQVRRTRTIKGRRHVEVAYLICSLPMEQAQPEQVAAWI